MTMMIEVLKSSSIYLPEAARVKDIRPLSDREKLFVH